MTVHESNIRAEVSAQVIEASQGVVDVSKEIITKAFNHLRNAGLTQAFVTKLVSRCFKIPHPTLDKSIIKQFSGVKCDTINTAYLNQYCSTGDRKIKGTTLAECLPIVVGYAYFPSFGPYVKSGGAVFYNTWRPPVELFDEAEFRAFYEKGASAYSADLDKFLQSEGAEGGDAELRDTLKPQVWKLFEMLWFPNKPDEADIFTDWLSLIVTYPDYRTRWSPVIRSEQGMGKGVMLNHVLRPLLGESAIRELSYDRVTGKFSGDQFFSRLVVLNEVKAKTPTQYNNLKTVITDDYHIVERKGEQAFQAKMFFATLLFTNEEKPLSIPKDDRRYWFPDYINYPDYWGDTASEREEASKKFFAVWLDALDTGGLKEIAMYFRWLALCRAKLHMVAPFSEAKDAIISRRTEDACDKLAMYLLEKYREGEGIKVGDLQRLFSPDLSDTDVIRVLKEEGFKNKKVRITGIEGQIRCWCKGDKPVTSLHTPRHNSF